MRCTLLPPSSGYPRSRVTVACYNIATLYAPWRLRAYSSRTGGAGKCGGGAGKCGGVFLSQHTCLRGRVRRLPAALSGGSGDSAALSLRLRLLLVRGSHGTAWRGRRVREGGALPLLPPVWCGGCAQCAIGPSRLAPLADEQAALQAAHPRSVNSASSRFWQRWRAQLWHTRVRPRMHALRPRCLQLCELSSTLDYQPAAASLRQWLRSARAPSREVRGSTRCSLRVAWQCS